MNKNTLNLFSLFVAQGSNAILPLIIFPYVLTVVGSESYSLLVITEALMFIIYAFVLYSFEINGVSKIIELEDKYDSNALSKIYSKIISARLIILCGFILILLAASPFLEKDFFFVLMIWMLIPLSYIFQSSYFFLALEENLFLALFIGASRALCVLLIFITIKSKADLYFVPLIIGLTFTLGSLCSFLYAMIKFKLHFYKVTLIDIKDIYYDGKEIFLGNISVLLLRDFNILILGLFTNNAISISTYSIAEKIIKSLQASIRPLNQFFFPKGVFLIKNIPTPNKKAFHLLSKISIPQLIVLGTIVSFLIVGYLVVGDKITYIREYPNINLVIQLCAIMVFSVFIGVLNFMYGTVGLNHLQSKGYYAKSIFFTGILSIIMALVLISLFHEVGASINFVLAEGILFYFIFNKYNK